MRKVIVAVLLSALLVISGSVFAATPDSDVSDVAEDLRLVVPIVQPIDVDQDGDDSDDGGAVGIQGAIWPPPIW